MNLREIREKAGIDPQRMANELAVSLNNVLGWEYHNMKPEDLRPILRKDVERFMERRGITNFWNDNRRTE